MQNSHESKSNVSKDDCGDYRKGTTKILSKPNSPITKQKVAEIEKEKQLINCGLHKLISSFSHHAQKVNQKASKINASKNQPRESSPNKKVNSHIPLRKQESVDKYTMTDLEQNEKEVPVQSAILEETRGQSNVERPYQDMQWTDPRLLKKYSIIKRPFKKSLTIPHVSKSENNSVVEEELDQNIEYVCTNYKHYILQCLYYFCTISVSFIGSLCGIALITLILWKMLDENILNFRFITTKNDLFLKKFVRIVGNSILGVINNILNRALRLLTISTSEVFAEESQHQMSLWYQRLYQ